jgi:hypothetical protein
MHDKACLANDFPGFPRDIDWRFFNMAPPSQFLPKLTGTESYAFKNLHPENPLVQGTLPGMTARAFLVRKAEPDGFDEIPLTLTTILCFPHRERLILVHHGHARLAEEDGSDIARMVIRADGPGERRPAEAFRVVMVQRADTENGAIYALQDPQLVPEPWLLPGDEAETQDENTTIAALMARHRRAAEAVYPNIAMAPTATPSQMTVLIMAMPAHNLGTITPMTQGDYPGVGIGVASGMVMGPSRHLTESFTVLFRGMPATRLTSMTLQNSTNAPGARLVPSQPAHGATPGPVSGVQPQPVAVGIAPENAFHILNHQLPPGIAAAFDEQAGNRFGEPEHPAFRRRG